MSETRAERYADDFVAAQRRFIELIESLDDEQWRRTGSNYPERLNDEDEGRPVGVIAHHVADTEQFLIDRIYLMLEGKPLPAVNFQNANARHAIERAAVSRSDVLSLLRENERSIPPRVRAIPDDALDVEHRTPVGPATVGQRIERVLIGHLKAHQGSIEAAVRR